MWLDFYCALSCLCYVLQRCARDLICVVAGLEMISAFFPTTCKHGGLRSTADTAGLQCCQTFLSLSVNCTNSIQIINICSQEGSKHIFSGGSNILLFPLSSFKITIDLWETFFSIAFFLSKSIFSSYASQKQSYLKRTWETFLNASFPH